MDFGRPSEKICTAVFIIMGFWDDRSTHDELKIPEIIMPIVRSHDHSAHSTQFNSVEISYKNTLM